MNDEKNFKRFKDIIIFVKEIERLSQQNESEDNDVFSYLSELSKEELENYHRDYQWLLEDKEQRSPFEKNIDEGEILERTRKVFFHFLFNQYCQSKTEGGDNQQIDLILRLAKIFQQPVFGLRIEGDYCFQVCFPRNIPNTSSILNKKPLPPLVWDKKNGGIFLVYQPKKMKMVI